jgi:hypothetical protein
MQLETLSGSSPIAGGPLEEESACSDRDPSTEAGTKSTLRRERAIAERMTYRKILRYIVANQQAISAQRTRIQAIAQMVQTVRLDRVDRLDEALIRVRHTPRDVSAIINTLARCHGAHPDIRAEDIWEQGDQAIDDEFLKNICFDHIEEEVSRSSDATLPPIHTYVAHRTR